MTNIDLSAAAKAARSVPIVDWLAEPIRLTEDEAHDILTAALPYILDQIPEYITPTAPKPGTRWEYGIMRPASMPDMSGRPQWTQIVGATFASKEMSENARRRVPSIRGVSAVICRRLVSDWEEVK